MDETYIRIVLIGNGFDKALGLKTSYSDFILKYLKDSVISALQNQNIDNELISFEDIIKGTSTSIDFSISLIKEKNNVKELLEYLKEKIEITYKYDFFEDIVNKLIDARWVDIEQHYYDTLLKRFRSYKEDILGETSSLKYIFALNNCMDKLTDALNKYINEQENTFHYNYENNQMDLLFESFGLPLKLPNNALYKKINNTKNPAQIIFLNFNYTNTIKSIIDTGCVPIINKHIHIHGAVNNKNNPIIFGYGDDTKEDYETLEKNGEKELLRKFKLFQYSRTHYHNLLYYLDNWKFDVFIVGHSCGLSDGTLLKTIFEHKKCIGIQNFHYNGEEEDFNKRIEISRHFSNKVLMREKVLPFNKDALIPQL